MYLIFVCLSVCLSVCYTDLSLEDSGNYTCEIRGWKSTVLSHVTHVVQVRCKYRIARSFDAYNNYMLHAPYIHAMLLMPPAR